MKITVDTKEDSKEDIRKAIDLLKSFTEEKIEKETVKVSSNKTVDMTEIKKLLEKENRNPEKKKKEVQEEEKNEFTITPY